jgi:hypothetical protein
MCCPADVFMVHGLFAQTLKPPLTPGSEGVGTVASFSERFPLGQRVVAGEHSCPHQWLACKLLSRMLRRRALVCSSTGVSSGRVLAPVSHGASDCVLLCQLQTASWPAAAARRAAWHVRQQINDTDPAMSVPTPQRRSPCSTAPVAGRSIAWCRRRRWWRCPTTCRTKLPPSSLCVSSHTHPALHSRAGCSMLSTHTAGRASCPVPCALACTPGMTEPYT